MGDVKIALTFLGGLTALSLLLGLLFPTGKIMFLIPGYNAADEAEKARYNEKKLCWFASVVMLLLAAGFAVTGFGVHSDLENLVMYGSMLVIAVITLTLAYTKTGKRFMRS